MIEIQYGQPGAGGVKSIAWALGSPLPAGPEKDAAVAGVSRIDVGQEPAQKAVRDLLDRLGRTDRSVKVAGGTLRWHGGNARELLGLLWSEEGLAAAPKAVSLDSLTKASIDAMKEGKGTPVRHRLAGTDRRDEISAVSEEVLTRSHGRVVKTVFRLNGDAIPPRAVELLLAAHG